MRETGDLSGHVARMQGLVEHRAVAIRLSLSGSFPRRVFPLHAFHALRIDICVLSRVLSEKNVLLSCELKLSAGFFVN